MEKGEKIMFNVGTCEICGNKKLFHWDKPLTNTEKDRIVTVLCERIHNYEETESYGVCKHCGQIVIVKCMEYYTQDQKNKIASEICDCYKAKEERRIKQQVETATERVKQLFGEGADEYDLKPIKEEQLEFLYKMITLVSKRLTRNITLQLNGRCKARILLTKNGTIKVERIDTTKYQLEE